MKDDSKDAMEVWENKVIPVVIRRGGAEAIRIRIPYASDNRTWLRVNAKKRKPVWNKIMKCWELPASRFNEIVGMILEKFKSLYIIQPYKEKEVCCAACMDATGFECECSCMGANHGSGNSGGWYEVSEHYAVRYGNVKLACRLLTKDDGA
jgi:hypothetical protein